MRKAQSHHQGTRRQNEPQALMVRRLEAGLVSRSWFCFVTQLTGKKLAVCSRQPGVDKRPPILPSPVTKHPSFACFLSACFALCGFYPTPFVQLTTLLYLKKRPASTTYYPTLHLEVSHMPMSQVLYDKSCHGCASLVHCPLHWLTYQPSQRRPMPTLKPHKQPNTRNTALPHVHPFPPPLTAFWSFHPSYSQPIFLLFPHNSLSSQATEDFPRTVRPIWP